MLSIGIFFLWLTKIGDDKWKKLLVPENCYEGTIIDIVTKKYWHEQLGYHKEGEFAIVEIETKEKEKKRVDLHVTGIDVPIGTKIDVYYNKDVYNYAVIPDRGQQRHAKYLMHILGWIIIIGAFYLLF